jgi:hypothetical protein
MLLQLKFYNIIVYSQLTGIINLVIYFLVPDCMSSEVLCGDGNCKTGEFCDGFIDCKDWSDENRKGCNNPRAQQALADTMAQKPGGAGML